MTNMMDIHLKKYNLKIKKFFKIKNIILFTSDKNGIRRTKKKGKTRIYR